MNDVLSPKPALLSRIGNWGGSCAIRLPKVAVENLGLREGETVSLFLNDGELVVRPAKQRYSLTELVEQAKTLEPPESSDDATVGNEA